MESKESAGDLVQLKSAPPQLCPTNILYACVPEAGILARQIGTVIVPANEYYSAGATKKQLKQGALAALQGDSTKAAYTKRKFMEVQEKAAAGGKKHYKKMQQQKRAKWART